MFSGRARRLPSGNPQLSYPWWSSRRCEGLQPCFRTPAGNLVVGPKPARV